MARSDESLAREILDKHSKEIDELSSKLASLISGLRHMDIPGWRRDGCDLLNWMQGEAEDMAKVERDVATTKVTGGSAAILGGAMAGAGIVASFFTFGVAAPLALAGVALSGAGAATSAGGEVAQLSIVHMKACKIKERCEKFEQGTREGVLKVLMEMEKVMSEISRLCQQNNSDHVESSVIEIVIKGGKSAWNLVTAGVAVHEIAMIVYEIAQLERSGVIIGADFLKLVAGSITGSGLTLSRALAKGASAAVSIAFGIWDVVDASGTLKDGAGSHSALIRVNASQIKNSIEGIDKALHQLHI